MTTRSPSRMISTRRPLAAVALGMFVACGGGGGDAAGPRQPAAASLRLINGDHQTGPAGTLLTNAIVVEVVDAAGASVAGTVVAFAVTAGGGTVSVASGTSDAQGRVTTQWTVGSKVGVEQQITVSIPANGAVAPLTVTASTTAGPPVTLVPSPSNLSAGPAGSNLVLDVKAMDAGGNPVAGAVLTWTDDSLPPPYQTVATDTGGVAHIHIVLGATTGPLHVTVGSGPNVSTTMTVQVTHAQFAKFNGPDSAAAPAGTSLTLTFTAVDVYGNPISGQSLYAEEHASFFGPPITLSTTTGADGTANVQLNLGPYAGTESVNVFVAPGGTAGYHPIAVYRTAARGAVQINDDRPCAIPAGQDSIRVFAGATVFGPNGHAAPGLGLTFSVQPGNGFLVTDESSSQHLSTYVGTTNLSGEAVADWHIPSAIGAYHMFAQGPPGYDGAPPADIHCSVG